MDTSAVWVVVNLGRALQQCVFKNLPCTKSSHSNYVESTEMCIGFFCTLVTFVFFDITNLRFQRIFHWQILSYIISIENQGGYRFALGISFSPHHLDSGFEQTMLRAIGAILVQESCSLRRRDYCGSNFFFDRWSWRSRHSHMILIHSDNVINSWRLRCGRPPQRGISF